MSHLLRELAPLSERAWEEVDQEARTRLEPGLAARRLVDFHGPHGWDHSSYNLGRVRELNAAPGDGVEARLREVQSLVELRLRFVLNRQELMNSDRGATDVDFGPLDDAAEAMARAENAAVFHGFQPAGITGIIEASSQRPVAVDGGYQGYPRAVAVAVEHLMRSGIGGPYGLALGSEAWTGVVEAAEHGGYPLFQHVSSILQGPIVWTPGLEGGVVVSQQSGLFHFECGQDLSVGYLSHTADTLELYLEESFTFRVLERDAAVALQPAV